MGFPQKKKLIKKYLKKRVPIIQWLPQYTLGSFFSDLLAGFTVSLTEIPQGIALAGVSGVTPEYGLYSCLMGGLAYAIFGSCKDVNIGPTSIMSIMIQPYVAKFGPQVSVLLSFICGIVILLLGLLNLGFVIEFFSYPIVAGFTCAASLEIASIQLKSFFGIKSEANGFIEAWSDLFTCDGVHMWDTILGVGTLLFLICFREIKRFGTLRFRSDWSRTRNIVGVVIFLLSIARNAIIIVIGMVLAYCWRDSAPFTITGDFKGGFPPLQPPPFSTSFNGTTYTFTEIVSGLGASTIFLPLIAILEAVTIAKSFTHGQSLDATQEILSLGIANLLNSFVGAYPITGGFTRSAINNASGVKTQLGGILTTILTLLAIAFLTPTFYYVPKATMAAVIIGAMIYLFEYEAFIVLWKHRKPDLIPFFVTIFCCLFVSLEYGILIGIAVNILFVLYPSARPKIKIDRINSKTNQVLLVKPLDTLYFPAAENLRDKILECPGTNSVVVLDGEYLRKIDITVARSLVTLSREMKKRDNAVVFWRFKSSIMKVCVGLDQNLMGWFKSGELEDVIQEASLEVV